jgi:predicted N-acyltransferase
LNISVDDLPFESWEKLTVESAGAFSAFCAFRDFGPDRNIKRALESSGSTNRNYKTWRNWSSQFHWDKRAADYDKYLDRLRLTERRKAIETREEVHKQLADKMLFVVGKKLDTMNPEDLTQNNVTEWMKAAIQTEREIFGMPRGEAEPKQGELNFMSDFQGI